jgi:hypothetical protein
MAFAPRIHDIFTSAAETLGKNRSSQWIVSWFHR